MKFLIRTHGCRANQYDSEAARRLLLKNDAVEVTDPGEADVAIFNSCSVTAAAEAELRKDVRRVARRNPRLRTIVIGCAPGLAGRDERTAPLRTLPTVTDTLPGADLDAIGATLGLSRRSRDHAQTGARALLRIQDGCDEHCTFCATTLARGASRSRRGMALRRAAVVGRRRRCRRTAAGRRRSAAGCGRDGWAWGRFRVGLQGGMQTAAAPPPFPPSVCRPVPIRPRTSRAPGRPRPARSG